MNLEELNPGQQVRCEVERNHKEDGSERLTAFEIRLESRT
jgi:cold shock CspA family protein